MKLIVGLGNPGTKYASTKHNFGFWIIDQLVSNRSLKYKLGKGDFIFAKDQECFFVKPTNFVNNSGVALKQILQYYDNIHIDDLIVVYDDIDIQLGNIRFKPAGADGGHNGIKSIIYHLETDTFDRLKVGIATNLQMRPSEKYVLKPFPMKFKKIVNEVIDTTLDGINYYLQYGINKTMNKYNKKGN